MNVTQSVQVSEEAFASQECSAKDEGQCMMKDEEEGTEKADSSGKEGGGRGCGQGSNRGRGVQFKACGEGVGVDEKDDGIDEDHVHVCDSCQ